jgi:hypothetical protein
VKERALKQRYLFITFVLLISSTYAFQGAAMSLFFGGEKVEAVLFSPLEGKLTFNGKPASGAKIKLWLAWKDEEGESEFFTADENGYFSIPKKSVVYKQSPLAQISIGQLVTVYFNNQEILIWRGGKSKTHLYSELGGRPEGVTCELTKENLDPHLDFALIKTRCIWNSLNKDMEQKND